eukprot:6214373-Pleurochrysis_carterae.AAC.1
MCQFVSEDREMTGVQIFVDLNVNPTMETTSPHKLHMLHQLLKSKDGHSLCQLASAGLQGGRRIRTSSAFSLAVKQLKQNATEEMALLAKLLPTLACSPPARLQLRLPPLQLLTDLLTDATAWTATRR